MRHGRWQSRIAAGVVPASEEFLSGAALSERVRYVCGGEDVNCAVSSWGAGVEEHLFSAERGGTRRIVCDVSMQATSRKALRELGAPNNANLKVYDGLDAKVYISTRGAVIGSANANAAGLGLLSDKRGQLLGAGVYCPPGSEAWRNAVSWFGEIFEKATTVGIDDLERAPERSAELHPVASSADLARMPLLQRLRQYPAAFGNTHIAIANRRLDEAKAKATKTDRARWRDADARSPDEVVLQVGEGGEIHQFSGSMLLFLRSRSVTRVLAYIECTTWPIQQPDSVFGIEGWSEFWQLAKQKPPKTRLLDEESDQIALLLEQEEDRCVFHPMEFAEKLIALQEKAIVSYPNKDR